MHFNLLKYEICALPIPSAGDCIMLESGQEFMKAFGRSSDFVLVSCLGMGGVLGRTRPFHAAAARCPPSYSDFSTDLRFETTGIQ